MPSSPRSQHAARGAGDGLPPVVSVTPSPSDTSPSLRVADSNSPSMREVDKSRLRGTDRLQQKPTRSGHIDVDAELVSPDASMSNEGEEEEEEASGSEEEEHEEEEEVSNSQSVSVESKTLEQSQEENDEEDSTNAHVFDMRVK